MPRTPAIPYTIEKYGENCMLGEIRDREKRLFWERVRHLFLIALERRQTLRPDQNDDSTRPALRRKLLDMALRYASCPLPKPASNSP